MVIVFMFQMLSIYHMPWHIILPMFYDKCTYSGMQNKFLVKKLTLGRYLISSSLIIYLPGEQWHSWWHCSGAAGTACSQTYRTAMKRDIKRPYGFMFISCAGRHCEQKMLKPLISIRGFIFKTSSLHRWDELRFNILFFKEIWLRKQLLKKLHCTLIGR